MRRSPKSYTDMTYHSQVVYLFIPNDQRHFLVKFRLVPGNDSLCESGLLDDDEQKEPWFRFVFLIIMNLLQVNEN